MSRPHRLEVVKDDLLLTFPLHGSSLFSFLRIVDV